MSIPIFAGLFTSILHVISGPDHLAAVTPFAIDSKRRAWKIGLLWGIGHIVGMVLIGLLFLAFKSFINVEAISEHSEQLVGVILILLGLYSFYTIFRRPGKHRHLHIHSENVNKIHKHSHSHGDTSEHEHEHKDSSAKGQLWSSLLIGILHGFAGISHFILLTPVATYAALSDSLSYIGGFAIGTILAMVAYAVVIGRISILAKDTHNDQLFTGIRLVGGLFALIIGIYWLI